MATQSRARTFHKTAQALRSATDRRNETALDPSVLIAEIDERPVTEPSPIAIERQARPDYDREALAALHAEFRWAESRLMQASERLAEAEEARRKDLVALERMRIDLKRSLGAERGYLSAQLAIFAPLIDQLAAREQELMELVEQGARTEAVIGDLAAVTAERKMYALAVGQIEGQLTLIDENELTLDHDAYAERYDRSPDGDSMRELARLRKARRDAERTASAARVRLAGLFDELGMTRRSGELAAIAAFMAADLEGDTRARIRVESARAMQVEHELQSLPEPTSEWKAGLRHPISWMRSRRTTGA